MGANRCVSVASGAGWVTRIHLRYVWWGPIIWRKHGCGYCYRSGYRRCGWKATTCVALLWQDASCFVVHYVVLLLELFKKTAYGCAIICGFHAGDSIACHISWCINPCSSVENSVVRLLTRRQNWPIGHTHDADLNMGHHGSPGNITALLSVCLTKSIRSCGWWSRWPRRSHN